MKAQNLKIVIMGGSFNPPTLAHYMLMKYAIEAIDATHGYFVPVSDTYLRRKMRHTPLLLYYLQNYVLKCCRLCALKIK